ncbi:hypothetical protein AUJ84_04010 [Candidatus Pacearchaeota archaeon CG1_02_32_132]|nr:MAG: hypothetical protein AUJ84_04010 [Candidatus Pacearchaeota archaeon CG1_02_32_132]
MKDVKVILSLEAKQVYDYLNRLSPSSKKERMIFKAVSYKIDLIKNNFQYGDPIAKNLIPAEYKNKYGINNLFRVELPDFWRMLYSVSEGKSEIEIIAFVLDIINHKDYNTKWGYR